MRGVGRQAFASEERRLRHPALAGLEPEGVVVDAGEAALNLLSTTVDYRAAVDLFVQKSSRCEVAVAAEYDVFRRALGKRHREGLLKAATSRGHQRTERILRSSKCSPPESAATQPRVEECRRD